MRSGLCAGQSSSFTQISTNHFCMDIAFCTGGIVILKQEMAFSKLLPHPFKIVDFDISATSVANRCIKLSTQPCSLHRQTLAEEELTEELNDFQRSTVIGGHLSNKSVQISALLELPRSTVSTVIVKWKHLEATTATMAPPRSGRPHELTERDRQVLKHIVCKNRLSSLPSSKLPLEATSAQALFVGSFLKWVSMAEQPHTSLRSPCTMPSAGWSGVKLTAIGLWSSGNVLSGVMNHASPSGSATDASGFGGCQEITTCPNAYCQLYSVVDEE